MKLALVLPRNMSFGPRQATAIDLCAHDYLAFSRFARTTRVHVEPIGEPYADLGVEAIDTFSSQAELLANLRAQAPDIVLVEQHRPTAMAIARALASTPVVVRRHGLEQPAGLLRRWRIRRDYKRLAGLIAVSETIAATLRPLTPEGTPLEIVHNGLDFEAWHPAEPRQPVVLFAGRLTSEKGVLEAAEAVASVLPHHPDWSATFLLAEGSDAGYGRAVTAKLAPLGARCRIAMSAPHADVKRAFETAAIALVPSRWVEPFGRTALEAFAGGATLICSARGGLREIAGEDGTCAVLLDDPSPPELARQIARLIDNPADRHAYARAARARGFARFDIRSQAGRIDGILAALSAGDGPDVAYRREVGRS